MSGMNRHTGLGLGDALHLSQSILDILTTPKGTRVMLRDYGSELPNLIDQPINGETLIDLYQATAEALDEWEPRIELARVQVVSVQAGRVDLELTDAQGGSLLIEVAA